ncbi:hypothetical protein N0V82_002799 [Gnomoniopsis sp. IMI 355080]|nr:hypothetical protein N0V82_002799 [Gnomoniopsis sp. IMI 355080]
MVEESQTFSTSNDGQLIGCELQLTLMKNEPPRFGPVELGVNEKTLAPEAFSSTRTFTIRLFKGQFPASSQLMELRCLKEQGYVNGAEEEAEELARIDSEAPKYSLKMTFDKSPWPLREHWIGRKVMQDMFHFWDEVEFVNPEWRSFKH